MAAAAHPTPPNPAPHGPCRLHSPPQEYEERLQRLAAFVQANRSWLPVLIWADTSPQARRWAGDVCVCV